MGFWLGFGLIMAPLDLVIAAELWVNRERKPKAP